MCPDRAVHAPPPLDNIQSCNIKSPDTYANCHRYDQSAMNILLNNKFNCQALRQSGGCTTWLEGHWSSKDMLRNKSTVQITFIFIDFRVCDFAFAFKTQTHPAFRVVYLAGLVVFQSKNKKWLLAIVRYDKRLIKSDNWFL